MLIFLSKMRVEIQENQTLAVEDSSRKRSGRSQSVSMMNGVMSIHGRNTDMEPPVGMSCKRPHHTHPHTHTHTLTEACVHALHGPPSEHECRFEWLSLLCDCQ